MSKFAGRGLATEQTFRVQILHPLTNAPMRATLNGEEVEAYVEGYSMDSRKARAVQQANTDRRLRMKGNQKFSAADLEAERAEFLAELTTGWLIVTPDGDVIEDACTPQSARELYSDNGWLWLRDQVEAGLGDRANFTRKPTS